MTLDCDIPGENVQRVSGMVKNKIKFEEYRILRRSYLCRLRFVFAVPGLTPQIILTTLTVEGGWPSSGWVKTNLKLSRLLCIVH